MKDKLIELRERIEKCSFKQDKTRTPWFFESEDLKGFYGVDNIFFVSQRPSTGKSHNSKPRVERYYRLLKEHGFENAHLTDLVKCQKRSGPLTKEEKRNCIHWLLKEISILKPALIVAVGGEVYKELKKQDLPVSTRLEKILHYSQVIEKSDFVEVFSNQLQNLRELADQL